MILFSSYTYKQHLSVKNTSNQSLKQLSLHVDPVQQLTRCSWHSPALRLWHSPHRSVREEKCVKKKRPGLSGLVQGQCWAVASRGHQTSVSAPGGAISLKPAASKGRVVAWSIPIAVFIQFRMSQIFSWCEVCQRFIHNLQQLYRRPHVWFYVQEVTRNLYLKQNL